MNPISRLWNLMTSVMRPVTSRIWMSQRQAGVFVNEDTSMTLSGWFACVSVLSRTLAALPWHVYERSPDGRRPTQAAIEWLLNTRPNPEMTAFSLKEAIVAHALNWGNGYAEIQRDLSGRVVGLWLLTPDRVTPERDRSDGRLVYRVNNETNGDSILEASDVYHLHGLGFDGLVGYSLVRLAARSIGLGMAQDEFGASFYENGTVHGTLVEMPQNVNSKDIEAIEGYYNAKHQGPSKAFKIKVASKDTKVHQMGMPLVDAQFIEGRKLSVTECARWLGVPPHKIADLERSTNNNIEHQGIEFITDAIEPWARRMEQEADFKLFGQRAQGRIYTRMALNARMRGDSAARAAFYRTMTQIGAMTVNEVRDLEELNSIGDSGDAHLVQLNQTTLEYLVDNPGAKAGGTSSTTDPSADPQDPQDPNNQPAERPTNVIRAEALAWARQQRKEA